jgi:hypothetical protein
MSHWIKFLGKFYKDKQKTNKDYTYKQAMKDAAKEYKHTGGNTPSETPKPTLDVAEPSSNVEISPETVGGSAQVSQTPAAHASASVNSPSLLQKGGKKSKTAKKSNSKKGKTCKNKSCKK